MEEPHDIELIDYLKVIWKWKWLIIIFTLCSGIIAGLISFSMPNVYEAFMIIEPGIIGLNKDSEYVKIDSASNIKFKIDSQAYNRRVIERLDADPTKLELRFKAIQLTGSNAIRISLETADVSIGVQALSSLFHVTSDEYKLYADARKSELDQKITFNKRKLDIYLSDKKKLEKEMALTNAEINKIGGEINNNMVFKEGDDEDKLHILIYASVIQQNKSHYNNLGKQISNLKIQIELAKSDIELLRINEKLIENMKLIQSPQSSIYPIKPKRKVSVATALIAGFLFSIFLSFFIEYIQKMKSHPGSSLNSI